MGVGVPMDVEKVGPTIKMELVCFGVLPEEVC